MGSFTEMDEEAGQKDDIEKFTADAKLRAQRLQDLQVYLTMILITLIAAAITGAKIKLLELYADDSNATTFIPLTQQVKTNIMYTGNGYMPPDYLFFHSGGEVSDRANRSLRILNSLKTG